MAIQTIGLPASSRIRGPRRPMWGTTDRARARTPGNLRRRHDVRPRRHPDRHRARPRERHGRSRRDRAVLRPLQRSHARSCSTSSRAVPDRPRTFPGHRGLRSAGRIAGSRPSSAACAICDAWSSRDAVRITSASRGPQPLAAGRCGWTQSRHARSEPSAPIGERRRTGIRNSPLSIRGSRASNRVSRRVAVDPVRCRYSHDHGHPVLRSPSPSQPPRPVALPDRRRRLVRVLSRFATVAR